MDLLVVWIATLCLVGMLVESQKAILSIKPRGPMKAGDTIHIICEITGLKPFEQVRIDRTIGTKEYEISTDDYIQNRFQRTERYHVTKWEPEKGLVELQIIEAVGGDGGNIGCRHLPSRKGYATVLTINVPPKAVEISYLDTTGRTYAAHDGNRVLLEQGTRAALYCTAEVDGTDIEPEVVITMNGKEVTSQFTKMVNRSSDEDDGLSGVKVKVTYKLLMENVDISRHGKNMTCRVSMPEYPPLATSILIEVDSKPHLVCEKELGGRLGDGQFEVACRGNMNPRPASVEWTWNDEVKGQIKVVNGVISDSSLQTRYAISSSEVGSGQYDFKLMIHQVRRTDFKQYQLQVTNTFGTATVYLTLREVFVTTPKQTTTSQAPQEIDEYSDVSPEAKAVSSSTQSRVSQTIILLIAALHLTMALYSPPS